MKNASVWAVVTFLAFSVSAQVPVADFDWTPENPAVDFPIEFHDRSTSATSTLIYVENSHPQPGPVAYIAFNVAGTYEIKLVATNSSGQSTKVRWVNAGVPAEARLSAFPPNPGVGQPVAFTDLSSGYVRSREWTFGDGSTSTLETPEHTYAAGGSYTVTLEARYASGSEKTSQTITVQAAADVRADFSWTPEFPKVGEDVQFTDRSAGDPTSWSWNFDDLEPSGQQSPKHVFREARIYAVVLAVGRGDKTDFTTRQVHVRPAGAAGITPLQAAFTWFPPIAQAGQDVLFDDRSIGKPSSWRWTFGDGGTASDRSPTHRYGTPGAYTARLEVGDGIETSTTSLSVPVVDQTRVVPAAEFYAPCCSLAGEQVAFLNQSSQNAKTFLWNFGDGTTSSERDPLHTWPDARSYLVTLTASNDDGSSVRQKSIAIEGPPRSDFTWSPLTPAAGQQILFTNLSSENAMVFIWTIDGRQMTTKAISHSFTTIGLYQVSLEVRTAQGYRRTTTKTIKVLPTETLSANVVCAGDGCRWIPGKYWRMEPVRVWSCIEKSTGAPTHVIWGGSLWEGLWSRGQITPWIPGFPFQVMALHDETGTVTYSVYRSIDDASSSWSRTFEGASLQGEGCLGGGNLSFTVAASFSWSPPLPKVGDEVVFQDTTQNGMGRRWEIDGVTSSEKTVRHRFTRAGRHGVQLSAWGSGIADRVTRIVVVDNGNEPAFKKVESLVGQCFFSTAPVETTIRAEIDWKGEPGEAWYSVGDGTPNPVTPRADGTVAFPLDSGALRSAGLVNRNEITIGVKNSAGVESRRKVDLYVFDTSSYLTNVTKTSRELTKYVITNSLKIPNPPWEGGVTIPLNVWVIGGREFRLVETQGTLEQQFDTDCGAAASIAGQTGFKAGDTTFTGELHGKQEMKLSFTEGIFSNKSSVGFEIAGTTSVEAPLLATIPQLATICRMPLISSVCNAAKVKSDLKVGTGADFAFTQESTGLRFFDATALIKVEPKLALVGETSSKSIALEGWGGGGIQFVVGLPRKAPDFAFFKKAEVTLEMGVKARAYVFEAEEKAAFTCTYEKAWVCAQTTGLGSAAAVGARPLALRPMPVQRAQEVPARRVRALGESVVLESLSPIAAPSAVSTGSSIVAVYLTEKPDAANPLHRTDLRYVVRSDGAWSASRPLTSDDLGDFAPSLVSTADGNVIAIWQRIRNASLRLDDVKTTDDLPKLNREMEIVASTFSAGSGTWSQPLALTDNTVYDHDPVGVVLADGRVIALWLRDPSNALSGTPASPTQLVARAWSNGTWETEVAVAGGLTGVQGLSAAAHGNEATVVLSRDKDGDPANENDREITYFTLGGGAWSGAHDLTDDTTTDLSPRVVYQGSTARVLWLSGSDLVWQQIGGPRSVIRAGGGTAALLGAVVAAAPTGHIVVGWCESQGGTTDVIVRTWDPATGLWGGDIALTRNDAVESSLSIFFAADRLHVVGLETNVKYSDVTRTIDGKDVVIRNVAGPGTSNLLHLEKALVVDLAIEPNTISAGAGSPASGETVRITAMVRNTGDLPLRDVPLVLFAGRGTTGSTLAQDVVAGDWKSGETKTVGIAFTWNPAVAEVTLAVDPLGVTGDRIPDNNTAVYSYLNRPPVACVQVSRMMGAAPLTVTFDASCSSDSDGTVVATRWDYADGSLANGAVATHTFEQRGEFPVMATVTDDLGRSSRVVVSIYVDTLADPRIGREATSLILPVVGRTAGAAGTFFVSDATIFNRDSGRDLVVDAMYMPDGRDDIHYARLTVQGDHLLALPDLLAGTFHTAGAGWARFDLSHPHAVITSRSYNKQPTGTAGTFVPGVTRNDSIIAGSKRIFLQDWREGFRVNLSLTEVSGEGSNVTVNVHREDGQAAGTKTYELGPYDHIQIGGEPLFQSRGRIEITVDQGQVLAYVSTVDNGTGDAVIQVGTETASLPVTTLWLVPGIVRSRGANETVWRSDLRVCNPGPVTQTVTLSMALPARTIETTRPLNPGQTAAWDDAVAALFPELSNDVAGPLTVSAPGAVIVTSRTYNLTGKGTYGSAMPALLERQLLVEGDVGELIQLQNDDDYRCNFGATAFGGPATIVVRAFDERGRQIGERPYGIGAGANLQVNRVFEELGVTVPLAAARLQVTVLSGRVCAYASVIDNKTGDSILVEAAR